MFMNMTDDKNILTVCEETATSLGFLYIDGRVRGSKEKRLIEVYIDSRNQLSVEDCALVSREINAKIEAQNLLTSAYRLEVSSPGVDRPLKFAEQFEKHISRVFEIVYRDAEGEIKADLRLLNVTGNSFLFSKKNGDEILLPFENIISAKVKLSFS